MRGDPIRNGDARSKGIEGRYGVKHCGLYKEMSSKTQQMSFLPVNGPQEVARDMTDENITRKSRTPDQTCTYFIIVSLAICLLAALGTIVVLVVQGMGSFPRCDGCCKPEENATRYPQMVSSKKPFASLQVLKPIDQPQLRWIKVGILYNMEYRDDGNLVIQQSGLYFIYCHLQVFIKICPDVTTDLMLEILVNGISKKQTLLTLCSCKKTSNGTYHDLFQVLLMELKMGYHIAVKVENFQYVDTDVLASNNVLGVFMYNGEDWGDPFFKTVVQNGL